MPNSQIPNLHQAAADVLRAQAADNRETIRPSDSVPVMVGQFAVLPATFGRYQVERLLGRGAMGAVYLARDTQLNRYVALKIPKVSAAGSKRLLQRLEIEAKAAARLDHPGLCNVFDAGEVAGQCFIAMQYIEGETLKSQLEVQGKTVEEAVWLILELADGLWEAHAQGIIHRDLKPENIMINQRGMPVVMDFGLAKFSTLTGSSTVTQAGTILGTPTYMSPEQASGNLAEIDQRSDIYSLGIILFEMLTGKFPFDGTTMQILGQKSILDPVSPLSINPDLPPQLAAICHKMIAKNNADRYPSLTEVIIDLRDVDLTVPSPVDVESPLAQPPSTPVAFADFVASSLADKQFASISKRKSGKLAKEGGKARVVPTTLTARFGAWWNGQKPVMKWSALGGAAFLFLCGVIIITITNQDGTQTTIKVPGTSTVTVTTPPPNDEGNGASKTPDPLPGTSTVTVTTLPPDDKGNGASKPPDALPATSDSHVWTADATAPAIVPFAGHINRSQSPSVEQPATAPGTAVPVDGANISASFQLQNLRLVDADPAVGDVLKFSYAVANVSGKTVLVPMGQRFIGVRQHWIERLGDDSVIAVKPKRIARDGQRDAVSGYRIAELGATIAAGQSVSFVQRHDTKGLPPGKYRFYVEFKDNTLNILHTEQVEFELKPTESK